MSYQYNAPPKSKVSVFKVFLGVSVVVIVIFIGLAAILSDGTESPSSPSPGNVASSTSPGQPKDGNLHPKLVKGHQVGPFKLGTTVKVVRDSLGSFDSNFTVINNTDIEALALFTLTVLKDDNILGTLMCIGGGGNPVKPGAVTTVSCISDSKFKSAWTQLQLEYTGL